MIRLLAMDLDETLLGTDKHVSEENRQALRKARENGIRTVIATGRPWYSFCHTLDEIETRHIPGEYSVSLNGGAIVENEDGKLVDLEGLDFETMSMLFEKAKKYDVCVHLNAIDKTYGWHLDDDEREFLRGRLEIIELDSDDIEPLKNESFVKILYEKPDVPYLASILEDMKGVAGDYDVSFSSSRYLEFNKKGVSKGEGLKKLSEITGIPLSEIAAIGDHANDLTMLETAGVGLAVANAIDEAKERAEYVTKADHNHGAIAEAVEYLLERNCKESEAHSA